MKIKHPEFQTAYDDIEPKNILIFEKLKPKRHACFLDILSREKGLFVSSHVSVGLPGRREVEEPYYKPPLGILLRGSTLHLGFILMIMTTVSHSH